MKDDNKLKISEASLEDYSEVVHLFNRNHVYQFPDGRPLTVDDLDLTLKVKEVTHLFLLKNHGVLIGTSAFFKFITYGCLDWNSSFSGFLLIDSKSRSGQAITYLYKTILKKITKLKFSNIYTEISNYNKPSLALSKLNGFKEYDKTYEDILHCRSLRSHLPKILNTFRISNYYGKTYDISTFQIMEEIENPLEEETEIRIKVSDEEILFKAEDSASLPYYLKMSLFQMEIARLDNRYVLQVDFLSEQVKRVRVKTGKYHLANLTRAHPSLTLSRFANYYYIQATVETLYGNIDVQLERRKKHYRDATICLKRTFQGYDLLISPNGSLIFEKQKRKILEDSFLIFSQPLDKKLVVKEEENHITIKCFYQGALIEKIMTFTSDEEITCVYKCNQKAKEMFPKLLKQTFKLHCQEQLIRDSEGYLVNVPGSYPIEHDDFLRADKFEDRQFHYYLPNEDKMISYSPPGKASNQMQFRPLCLIDTDSLSFPLTYHFRISQASSEEALINLKKQPIWDSNYQASATDLLKHISNLTLEEEKDYGIKRMIANRKHYPSHKLVLAYNQIVLPKNEIPRDSELYSISFDYRIRGKFVQIRQGEHVKYDNKSYVLENSQQLVLYVASDDKYILISAKNGIFYSYKENNHLKIRCMFKRNSPYATNVSITEYRKCEEK